MHKAIFLFKFLMDPPTPQLILYPLLQSNEQITSSEVNRYTK